MEDDENREIEHAALSWHCGITQWRCNFVLKVRPVRVVYYERLYKSNFCHPDRHRAPLTTPLRFLAVIIILLTVVTTAAVAIEVSCRLRFHVD